MMISSLSMVEAELPPGFRFHPRDEELVCDYLMKKVTCSASAAAAADDNHPPLLIEVDLNKCEPWDIPPIACVGGKEWYFYSQRDKKYATGQRTNRATMSGYWKATGKDRTIFEKAGGTLVGMRKTLVFYQGRAPHGKKTQWVMHEFRLEGPLLDVSNNSPKEDWVLCRMFQKKKEYLGEASAGSCSNDSTLISSSSSSLPPLMEPYISTFDQTHHLNHLNDYEYDERRRHHHHHHQMPCFSIFNQNQITPSHMHMNPNIFNNDTPTYLISSSCDDDESELKFVLDHLNTNMEMTNYTSNHTVEQFSPPTSSGDGSSDSFLSELGLSTMWNV